MLRIKGYYRSDTGKIRPHNEDRLCVLPVFDQGTFEISLDNGKSMLLAVADGMGGTNAGEVAAEIAIETVKNSGEKIDRLSLKPEEIRKGLEAIVLMAHQNIRVALNEENAGMGTTLILALLIDNVVYVAWCGDSRAYKYSPTPMERKNKYDLPNLKVLTHDHSVVWDMVRKGKLDPNAAREHELSNVITQSLGDPKIDPKPESAMYTIDPGDKILVCSDGLNSMLPDEFIQEILAHDEPIDALGNSLIEAANAEGGLDNISVIILHIDAVPDLPVAQAKAIKSRPEAITAKSNIGGLKVEKANQIKKWLMRENILFLIIILALSLLVIFISIWKYQRNIVPAKDTQQEEMSIPLNDDSSQSLQATDTTSIQPLNENEKDSDTIQKGN